MQGQSDPDHDTGDELIDRLRVIEDQPLAERAEAYSALHDELSHLLEAAPITRDGAA